MAPLTSALEGLCPSALGSERRGVTALEDKQPTKMIVLLLIFLGAAWGRGVSMVSSLQT